MTRRTIGRLAVSLLVLALWAELAGLAAHYIDTGGLFYTHPKTYQELLPTPQDRLVLAEAMHPYFGFTHRPGTPFDIPESLRTGTAIPARLTTNNFGFVWSQNYPFAKTSDRQFIIGLFGGSVGVWFCQIGAPRLVEDLKRQPFFRDREIVPLCFSHEGYKQPQEMLVLQYFLSIGQAFDLVINIDGFNDVALGLLNTDRGLEFSMPSVQHLDPLINVVNQSALTPQKLESLAAIFRYRRQMLDLADRIATNRLASVNFVLDWYYGRLLNEYVRELGRFSNLPSNPPENAFVEVARPPQPRDRTKLLEEIADVWTRSSVLMHEMLAARGAAYVHILQPNQYYTTRTFHPAEAATALNEASPYKRSVEDGYPLLVKAASELSNRHVRFFDATRVLDRVPAAVYMDNCCHYTLAGNHALADFIADSILGTPGPWRGDN